MKTIRNLDALRYKAYLGKNPPKECSSCYHWDLLKSTKFTVGHCVEICSSVAPDQRCNYEMMETVRHFCCSLYKRKNNETGV